MFLIDFGISKIFRDGNGRHIAFKESKPFIGTTRYAAISAHMGHELSRKDDLESLGYVLIFLFKGNLPWQNMQHLSDKEKTKQVGELKKSIKLQDLCVDMPIEFQKYLDYVRRLTFKATPDYKYLRSLMQCAGSQNNVDYTTDKFDWYHNPKELIQSPLKSFKVEKKNTLINSPDIANFVLEGKKKSTSAHEPNQNVRQSSYSTDQAQQQINSLHLNRLNGYGQLNLSELSNQFLVPPDSKFNSKLESSSEHHTSNLSAVNSSVYIQHQHSFMLFDNSPKYDEYDKDAEKIMRGSSLLNGCQKDDENRIDEFHHYLSPHSSQLHNSEKEIKKQGHSQTHGTKLSSQLQNNLNRLQINPASQLQNSPASQLQNSPSSLFASCEIPDEEDQKD